MFTLQALLSHPGQYQLRPVAPQTLINQRPFLVTCDRPCWLLCLGSMKLFPACAPLHYVPLSSSCLLRCPAFVPLISEYFPRPGLAIMSPPSPPPYLSDSLPHARQQPGCVYKLQLQNRMSPVCRGSANWAKSFEISEPSSSNLGSGASHSS